MSDVVIRATGLGKKYAIGRNQERPRYTALRDVIVPKARNVLRATSDVLRGRAKLGEQGAEEFWALKDVSFEIRRGEFVGIIGRNGAGKSTLLKILSRITEQSEGRVEIRGRIGSLLEVGTGFHPELTGRENIFLNGAILGMTRSEIKRKFDEIVAFAGVEKFLDTPVKRYSSGMHVRLAFAVAAHLEPEILVVDEVLAVGDAEFQKKCLGKMQDVAGHGRTVLFVSHNMASVSSLCARGMLLECGRIDAQGPINSVISQYSRQSAQECAITFPLDEERPCICGISVDRDALISRDVIIEITFSSPKPLRTAIGGIVLRSVTGEPVWGSNGRFHNRCEQARAMAHGVLRCEARGLPVTPGEYLISVWLGDWQEDFDSKLDALRIIIGDDRIESLRPPTSANGHLDWPAVWSSAEAGAACQVTLVSTAD